MPEPVKVNVVSYGGVKPGLVVAGNGMSGEKTTIFDAATATDGSYMFYGCNSLTSWNVALPNLTNGGYMFQGCSSLASWNVALPNLKDGRYMFYGCRSLASWDIDLPSLTNGTCMFQGCRSLASWDIDLPNLTHGSYMFQICNSLTSWNVALPNLKEGALMFEGCALDGPSVLLILSSIQDRAAAGLAVAPLGIGKRTNFKDDPDVQALLGQPGVEITAKTYSCKGWNVTVQNY